MILVGLFLGAGCDDGFDVTGTDNMRDDGTYFVWEWLVSKGTVTEEALWRKDDTGLRIGPGQAVMSRKLNPSESMKMEISADVAATATLVAVLEGYANVEIDTAPDTSTGSANSNEKDSDANTSPMCPACQPNAVLLWQKEAPIVFTKNGHAERTLSFNEHADIYWITLYKRGAGEILIKRLTY